MPCVGGSRAVVNGVQAPYYDYLQAPLQPLADDLESSTPPDLEARLDERVLARHALLHVPGPVSKLQ